MDAFAFQLVQLPALQSRHIVKLAVHACGQHCLALDDHGVVYSWGSATHGRLGYASTMSRQQGGPQPIEELDTIEGRIVDVFAGYAHSAAITEEVSVTCTLLIKF